MLDEKLLNQEEAKGASDLVIEEGTICVTGHRPDKLGGYSSDYKHKLQKFALETLMEQKPRKVITGMALGWDQAIAVACCVLEIPFIAAVPFQGQESLWSMDAQVEYRNLLHNAVDIVIIEDGAFAVWKMHSRNSWMVRHSHSVLALWNGSMGGTSNCIKYAQALGRPVINVWKKWESFRCLDSKAQS